MAEWVSRDRACVIVMEDAHAADVASLELAGYVGRRLSGLPFLLVLTRRKLPRRPEVEALVHRLPARGVAVRELELGPLDAVDVARLVRAVADLDDELVARIVDAAEGNPLLALESAGAAAAGREPVDGLRGVARVAVAVRRRPSLDQTSGANRCGRVRGRDARQRSLRLPTKLIWA
jgi:hypothetical protein